MWLSTGLEALRKARPIDYRSKFIFLPASYLLWAGNVSSAQNTVKEQQCFQIRSCIKQEMRLASMAEHGAEKYGPSLQTDLVSYSPAKHTFKEETGTKSTHCHACWALVGLGSTGRCGAKRKCFAEFLFLVDTLKWDPEALSREESSGFYHL